MSSHRILGPTGRAVWTKWTEPTHWQETPAWHPRRIFFGQNWRRFHPDYSGFAYENEGTWEFATDLDFAHWSLRQAAGLPDATATDAFA